MHLCGQAFFHGLDIDPEEASWVCVCESMQAASCSRNGKADGFYPSLMPCEASIIFRILDDDKNDEILIEEFINGTMSLACLCDTVCRTA